MSDPAWPEATVPHRPEYSGYGATPLPSGSSFKPDVGVPSSWPRTTLDAHKVQAPFVWNTTQRDAFYEFYNTTLKKGSRAFRWNNPAFSATGRYKFDVESPYSEEAIGYEMWRVSISVYRLGDA